MNICGLRIALWAGAALAVGCSHVADPGGGADGSATDSDADADTDTDADSDTDTDADSDTDTDTDTDTGIDTETVTDTDVLACIEAYDWYCDCMGECDDGFGWVVLYPDEAGDFTGASYPSDELLAAGVGWRYCSVCEECDEWSRIKPEAEWIGVDIYDFCVFVVSYDEACGGCLVECSGGGG